MATTQSNDAVNEHNGTPEPTDEQNINNLTGRDTPAYSWLYNEYQTLFQKYTTLQTEYESLDNHHNALRYHFDGAFDAMQHRIDHLTSQLHTLTGVELHDDMQYEQQPELLLTPSSHSSTSGNVPMSFSTLPQAIPTIVDDSTTLTTTKPNLPRATPTNLHMQTISPFGTSPQSSNDQSLPTFTHPTSPTPSIITTSPLTTSATPSPLTTSATPITTTTTTTTTTPSASSSTTTTATTSPQQQDNTKSGDNDKSHGNTSGNNKQQSKSPQILKKSQLQLQPSQPFHPQQQPPQQPPHQQHLSRLPPQQQRYMQLRQFSPHQQQQRFMPMQRQGRLQPYPPMYQQQPQPYYYDNNGDDNTIYQQDNNNNQIPFQDNMSYQDEYMPVVPMVVPMPVSVPLPTYPFPTANNNNNHNHKKMNNNINNNNNHHKNQRKVFTPGQLIPQHFLQTICFRYAQTGSCPNHQCPFSHDLDNYVCIFKCGIPLPLSRYDTPGNSNFQENTNLREIASIIRRNPQVEIQIVMNSNQEQPPPTDKLIVLHGVDCTSSACPFHHMDLSTVDLKCEILYSAWCDERHYAINVENVDKNTLQQRKNQFMQTIIKLQANK